MLHHLAQDVSQMDAALIRQMVPVLMDAKREVAAGLTAWLEQHPDNDKRFTAHEYRRAMLSLNKAMEEIAKRAPDVAEILEKGGEMAGHLATEHLKFEVARMAHVFGGPGNLATMPTQIDTAAVIVQGKRELIPRFRTSAHRYTQNMRKDIRHQFGVALAKGETFHQMTQRLRRMGGPRGQVSLRGIPGERGAIVEEISEGLFRRYRHWAERLVRTETMNAYNSQHALAIDELNEDLDEDEVDDPFLKRWDATLDSRICPICGPLDQVSVKTDEQFPGGYDHPPAHPYCRCVLVAWHPSWGDVDGELKRWKRPDPGPPPEAVRPTPPSQRQDRQQQAQRRPEDWQRRQEQERKREERERQARQEEMARQRAIQERRAKEEAKRREQMNAADKEWHDLAGDLRIDTADPYDRKWLLRRIDAAGMDRRAFMETFQGAPGTKVVIENTGDVGYNGGMRFISRVENAEGVRMASLHRTIDRTKAGNLVVKHDLFKFGPDHQKNSAGSWMIGNMFEGYERLGITKVKVDTAWVGNYYWAKVGFKMEPGDIRYVGAHVADKLRGHVAKKLITQKEADELLELFHKDPTEFARVPRDAVPHVRYKDPDGKWRTDPITKEAMLGPGARSWSGELKVGGKRWKEARRRLDEGRGKAPPKEPKAPKRKRKPRRRMEFSHAGRTFTRTTAREYQYAVVIERPGHEPLVTWHLTRTAAERVALPRVQKTNAEGKKLFRGRRPIWVPDPNARKRIVKLDG